MSPVFESSAGLIPDKQKPIAQDAAARFETQSSFADHSKFTGWLPTAFMFGQAQVSVRWTEFGSKAISEPFFLQTLRQLRTSNPPARECVTDTAPLEQIAQSLPAARIAGVIFHVSRCGSTLLANALRLGEGIGVLSEAQPLGTLFQFGPRRNPVAFERWTEVRRRLVDSVVRIYANYAGGPGARLVIKCQAASMLQISQFRAVWPDTPFLILIRDPVEVIVSNLAKPAGWVTSRLGPLQARTMFGLTNAEVQQVTIEEYCARGIGRFCGEALRQLDRNCQVVDYESLDLSGIYDVADFFDIRLPSRESRDIRRVAESYAKDPDGVRQFESDSERKQQEASAVVREAVSRWARKPYEALRVLEMRPDAVHA